MKLLLIHGPNLNLLGNREPEKYGTLSSEDIVRDLKLHFPEHEIDYYQSNNESELINIIQNSPLEYKGILINTGAFSHTSIAIADAIRSIKITVVNVHITNIYQRENYRHSDLVGEACTGSIVGLGIAGYALAIEWLLDEIIARKN